jgi:hypothetical protein
MVGGAGSASPEWQVVKVAFVDGDGAGYSCNGGLLQRDGYESCGGPKSALPVSHPHSRPSTMQ